MNTSSHKKPAKPAPSVPAPFDYNKRLDELTGKISDIVRSSSLGLLAVVWLGLSATEESAQVVRSLDSRWLMAGAAFALIALLLDFGQYVFGYFAVLGDKKTQAAVRHRTSKVRSARFYCFYGKMIFATLSSVAVISTVSAAVLNLKLWF